MPVAGRPPGPAPGWSLAAALLGFFVVTVDAVIVNVALPDIRRELAGGMSGLQWVVDGYTLMFAALLLSAGSLSDRLGARRAFGAGMVLFVLASAGCGLAPSLPVLVAARLVQGSAAAALPARRSTWPTSLAARTTCCCGPGTIRCSVSVRDCARRACATPATSSTCTMHVGPPSASPARSSSCTATCTPW
jgi:Major Facilitator Superfamily